jgi:hypothetical protein
MPATKNGPTLRLIKGGPDAWVVACAGDLFCITLVAAGHRNSDEDRRNFTPADFTAAELTAVQELVD